MSNDWVIADPHFLHANIIKYEDRPFKDVSHMTEELIKKWNNKVKKTDKIIVAGDFGMGHPSKYTNILARLNGRKLLIFGNHDRTLPAAWLEAGFDEVSRYPILYKGFYLISHKPIYLNEHTPYVNVYGHVHSHPNYETWAKQGVCVSLERHNYEPVSFEDIKEYFESMS